MSFVSNRTWYEALKVLMTDSHVNGNVPDNMHKLKKAAPEQLASLIQYRHGISYPAIAMLNYVQPFTRHYTALLILDDEKTDKTYLETLKGKRLMEIKRGDVPTPNLNDPIAHIGESIVINLSEHKLVLGRWANFKLAFIAGMFKKLAEQQFGKTLRKKK